MEMEECEPVEKPSTIPPLPYQMDYNTKVINKGTPYAFYFRQTSQRVK